MQCSTLNAEIQAEDHLEALIALLENVGKAIDDREKLNSAELDQTGALISACKSLFASKLSDDKITVFKFPISEVFTVFDLISEAFELSSRLSSLIQNLKHRKDNNWKAPEFTTQLPKTLKQIRNECDNESAPTPIIKKTDFVLATPSFKNFRSSPKVAPKLILEEVIKRFVQLFNEFETSSCEKSIIDNLKTLACEANGVDFTRAFIKTFSDGSRDVVAKRIALFPKLINADLIKEEDFTIAFGECLYYLWMEASDFPGIEANYAKIFFEITLSKNMNLNNFYIHPELASNEDKCYIIDTYNEFFNEMKKIITFSDSKVK